MIDLSIFTNLNQSILPIKLNSLRGRIPFDLRGTYIKNGPSWKSETKNPFDENGYITKISFKEGEAYYQSKYIDLLNKEKGSKVFGGPLFNGKKIHNPSNTNVVYWNKKLISLYEGGSPHVLNYDTLKTEKYYGDYKDGFPVEINNFFDIFLDTGNVVNAHPKIDKIKETITFVELVFTPGKTNLRFKEYDKNDLLVDQKDFYIDGFVYFHDFYMSEDYYIFIYHPLKFKLPNLQEGIAKNIYQDTTEFSKVYLLNRKNGNIDNFIIHKKDTFISHIINVIENENNIEIYGVSYKEYLDFKNEGEIIKISIENGKTITSVESKTWCEFPLKISDNVFYTCSNLGYGTEVGLHGINPMQGLYKFVKDSDRYRKIPIYYEKNKIIGEPVYDGKNRIISFCYDIIAHKTTLLIFENDILVSEINFPVDYVPIGIHGNWIENIT